MRFSDARSLVLAKITGTPTIRVEYHYDYRKEVSTVTENPLGAALYGIAGATTSYLLRKLEEPKRKVVIN